MIHCNKESKNKLKKLNNIHLYTSNYQFLRIYHIQTRLKNICFASFKKPYQMFYAMQKQVKCPFILVKEVMNCFFILAIMEKVLMKRSFLIKKHLMDYIQCESGQKKLELRFN